MCIIFICYSCSDCRQCSFENQNTTNEVCRNDYDSNADYQSALNYLEEQGADCSN